MRISSEQKQLRSKHIFNEDNTLFVQVGHSWGAFEIKCMKSFRSFDFDNKKLITGTEKWKKLSWTESIIITIFEKTETTPKENDGRSL